MKIALAFLREVWRTQWCRLWHRAWWTTGSAMGYTVVHCGRCGIDQWTCDVQ